MVKMLANYASKTTTIHDPETMTEREVVVIRSYYGDATRKKVMSAASEYRQDEEGRTVIVGTLDKLHSIKRQLAIVSWTLEDENGEPLPMTPDIVANLPQEVAAFIDGEIDRLWQGLAPVPAASQEEAEKREAQEAEERDTFHDQPVQPAVGQEDRPLDLNGAGTRAGRTRRPTLA